MVEKKFEKKRRKKWPRQSNQGGSDNLYSATIIEGLLGCFVSGSPISAIQEVEQLIEDFNISNLDHILRLPEILSKLQVDVFWILHLNGYIQFLEYINLTEAANVTEFIRRIYHAANAVTESIDDGKYMVPLSMCANIVLYLFNMTIAPGIPPLIDEKIRRILGDAFLPSPDMGPLDATDILIFTDLLATISCNIERDALQELQIEQISKLLSYQIRLHPVPKSSLSSVAETAHKSHYIDFIQGSEYEGPQNNCEGKHGREENFLEDSHPNGPFDCLVNLQLPLIVYLRAFDRALRGEDSSSPFDFQRNNTLMAETIAGTYSVMYLLFESASLDGLSTWKTTIPFDLKAETISAYIESRLTEARSVKTTIGNDRLLSEGSKWTVFPLLSMLYLATASARAGINEGSHTLWLRAVCFAERVTNSLRTNTTVSVLGTLSARDHKAADPGSALFADWFDQILGSTSTSTELSIHEGHLNTDLVEMIPGNGAEEDLGLEIPNHENKAGMNAKTLEFACLALCDCISYQKESVIRIICKAFRSRRSLSKDAVDIYLQAARDQIARIEKLEASHSKAESSVQSVFLTPERVISWASTLCRTGFLPVGVLQTCKTAGPLGYRGLLRALKLLCTSSSSSSSSSGSSPGIRESCISVVTAMSVADPPLCPVIEANNFLKSEGGDKNSKDDYIDAFLSSLPLRPSLRESLKESLAIISHAYAAVSQKSVYLAGTRDLMIGRWKIACRAILDQKTFSVSQRQYKNDNEQNSLMAPLSSSSSIVDYKDDRGRDFVGISEDESNDDLVHLNIASSICTSYFHLVSTIMDNFLQGLGEPLPSSSSFSSSSFSSSSSSSTSSSSSFLFNSIPESSKTFFLNWHEYVQSICTILLSSNSRLISGIIVAGIVSQIRGESLDYCYNGMKINIPSVLLGITSDSQLRMILEMCMTHLFPLRDVSSDVSSGARSGASDVSTADLCTINEKKCIEQRQLELFCESLYAVIMWHLTKIHYENEKVSDNFKGNEEHDTRQYKNSENDSKFSSINVEVPLAILLQKHPFLCGLYIWIVDRCVCSPSFSSTVIPTETSNLDSYCSAYYSRDGPSVRTLYKDEWKLLARNIILYGCHHQRGSASSPNDKEYSTDSEHMKMKEYSTRMNLSNKLSFASSDDVMAAAVVETLLGDELTFFLRWEASFLGLTHVRSDQHSAFQDVWDVLNFGNSGFLDLTETVTVTATGTGTGTILGQDRRISAVHLKNVWDALIHCIASLVPTSTCVCCLAVLSSPSHIADISSRSEQISKFNGVCRGGVISTGLSKVISTLTQCVLHTQAGHLKHEKQFYPFLSEQGIIF